MKTEVTFETYVELNSEGKLIVTVFVEGDEPVVLEEMSLAELFAASREYYDGADVLFMNAMSKCLTSGAEYTGEFLDNNL